MAKVEAFKNKAPIDAFSKRLQEAMEHYSETKGYPIDYLLVSVLTALGSAIGNSHQLRTMNGYTAKSNLFVAIVGRRGFNKSEALTDAYAPIQKFQSKLYLDYKTKQAEYNSLSKEEKESNPVPFFSKPILSDTTTEALVLQLVNYSKGSTIVVDELAGWIKSFNRYNSGADEQVMLSLWSGKSTTKDRATGESIYIESPFLSVIGTIQPEIAETVFSNKQESGFYDRILLCYPERITKPYPALKGLDPMVTSSYETIINTLLAFEIDAENQTAELTYTPESWEIVLEWIKKNTDAENNLSTTATEGGIRAKMDIYLHRFCLILQLASFASGETSNKETIEPQTARNAIRIANYFYNQAEKKRLKEKSELLTGQWLEVYSMLPDYGQEFTTAEFLMRTEMMDLNERTSRRWLKANSDKSENKLLVKIRHGVYSRC